MEKVNKPFVALLALVLGSIVTAFVAAIPGPPVKEVSTYTVVREAPFPNLTYCCGFVQVTVQAECNLNDSATGGGYEIDNGYEWTSSNAYPGDGFGEIFVQNSGPYVSATTGAQGWSVQAFASPMGGRQPPSPSISLRVTAICLHRA